MISEVESMCGRDIQSTWMAESRSYWLLVIWSCLIIENDQDFRYLKLLGNYSSSCKEKEPVEPAESWIWVLPLHWSGRGWGPISFTFPWKRRLDFNSQAAQSETPGSLSNSSQCITFRHLFTAAVGLESTTTWENEMQTVTECWGPEWGTPPMAKVMRKEARHTQRRDRASGVPLEILEHLPP